MLNRRRRLKREQKRVLGDFAAEHCFCWACGIPDGAPPDESIDYPRHLVIHHIVKPGRIHERWNLSRLCALCHDLAEGHRVVIVRESTGRRIILPRLTLANVLWLKRQYDNEHWDPRELGRHTCAGKRLPRAARPPGWFFKQWELQTEAMQEFVFVCPNRKFERKELPCWSLHAILASRF